MACDFSFKSKLDYWEEQIEGVQRYILNFEGANQALHYGHKNKDRLVRDSSDLLSRLRDTDNVLQNLYAEFKKEHRLCNRLKDEKKELKVRNCEVWQKDIELAKYLPNVVESNWIISETSLLQAEKRLEDCLKDIKKYQKQSQQDQALLHAKDIKIKECQRSIQRYQKDINNLKVELTEQKQKHVQFVLHWENNRHLMETSFIMPESTSEQVKHYKEKAENLDKQLILNKHKLVEAEGNITHLGCINQTLTAELEYLRTQNDNINTHNQKVEKQNSALLNELQKKYEEVKELRDSLLDERSLVTSTASRNLHLENSLATEQNNIAELKNNLRHSESRKTELQVNWDHAQQEIQRLTNENNELRSQIMGKEAEIQCLRRNQQRNVNKGQQEMKFQKEGEDIGESDYNISDDAKQLKQQVSFPSKKEELADEGSGTLISTRIGHSVEEKCKKLQKKLSEAERQFVLLQEKYESACDTLKEKEKQFSDSLEKEQETCKLAKLCATQLEGNIEKYDKQLTKLHAEVEDLSNRLQSKEEECRLTKRNLRELESKSSSDDKHNDAPLLQLKYENEAKSQQLKENEKKIVDLSEKLKCKQAELRQMKQGLTDLEVRSSKQMKAKEKTIADLAERLKCNEEELGQMKQRSIDLEERSSKQLKSKEKTIADLAERLKWEQLKLKQTEKRFTDLEERSCHDKDEHDADLLQLQLKCDDKCQLVKRNEETIADLTGRLSQNQARIQKLEKISAETQDLMQYKDQYLQLEDDFEQTCKRLKEKDRQTEDLSNRLSRAQAKSQEFQEKAQQTDKLLLKLQNDYEEVCNRLRDKDRQIEDLSKRLSKEMGQKVSSDESSLENVSIKNRPINIASEYELLCSNQWLSAKTDLDEKCSQLSEAERIRLLNDILMTGHKEGESMKKCLLDVIVYTLYNPGATAGGPTPKSASEMPEVMKNYVLDFMRSTADKANLSFLIQRIKHSITNNPLGGQQVFMDSGIKEYLDSAALIAWKMILQRPVMTLQQRGIGEEWQGENKQELFWSSSDPKDPRSRVKYYVHPSLYHGDAMMVKGRVYLEKAT